MQLAVIHIHVTYSTFSSVFHHVLMLTNGLYLILNEIARH